jgi:superfamily II DNA or RNA helicase
MPEYISTTDYRKIVSNYQKLPADDQRLLQVLSVSLRYLDLQKLKAVLQTLGWVGRNGEPLGSRPSKAWRDSLVEQGLLSLKAGRFHVTNVLRSWMSRELALRNEFAQACKVLDDFHPINRAGWSWENVYSAGLFKLRKALFSADYAEARNELGMTTNPWELLSFEPLSMLQELCLEPLQEEFLEQLPDDFRFQVIGGTLRQSLFNLQDETRIWELAREWFARMGNDPSPDQSRSLAQARPALGRLLAAQYLIRGQLDQAAQLLNQDPGVDDPSLTGWLLFLRGEHGRAIEVFEQILQMMKKQTRKRNVRIPGLPGLVQSLCLLGQRQTEPLQQLRKQVGLMAKDQQQEQLAYAFHILDMGALTLLGGMQPEALAEFIRGFKTPQGYGPYTALTGALIMIWLGEEPDPLVLKSLATHCRRAESGGYRWFSREAGLVLEMTNGAKLSKEFKKFLHNAAWYPLVDLLQPRQKWEVALEALKNFGSESASSRGQRVSDMRMTWRISCVKGVCTLEPREQKLKKNGQWTTGRPVALKRLRSHPESFPYLTDHDRRLCVAISEDTYQAYYYYSKTDYNLSGDAAIVAAVGHPLIFREEDLDHPVEVVQSEPALQVLREGGHLRLCLVPSPPATGSVAVQEESLHRIRVCQFSARHKKLAEILGDKGLKVPAKAREKVLESIHEIGPLVTVHANIGGTDKVQAESVAPDPRPVLRLRPLGEGLTLELFLRPIPGSSILVRPGEGGKTLFAEVQGRQVCATRDQKAEQAAVHALLERCPTLNGEVDWSWRLEDPEAALETLLNLQQLGDDVVLEWPEGKAKRIASETGLHQVKIGLRRKQDWFSMEGGVELDDGAFMEMSQLLALLENSPGRFVRLDEGDFLCLTRELRNRLDAIRNYSEAGRFHPLAAPVMDEVLDGMRVNKGKPWKDLLKRIRESQELKLEVPTALRAELREYQLEGFQWLARLAHWGAGACLADDMGLGKTIQSLALILTRAKLGPTLVLAPTSVCINWMQEAARFAPSLRLLRFGPGDRETMLAEASCFDLVVCSYGLLQSESQRLATVNWSTIVADEAQAIKNVFTKRSRAAMALPAGFKMITTGTPIENHLGELWNLFNFINPGLLGSLERFNHKFAVPIEQNRDANARRRLKNLIRPFILRRLKTEVLAELPSRTEVVMPVELSPQEAAVYDAIRRKALEKMAEPEDQPGRKRIKMLAEIMRLRRACCHPGLVLPAGAEAAAPASEDGGAGSAKLQVFGQILDDLLENRHQALVFSQFVDHLQLVRAYLDQRKVRYQYLDGSTPVKKRQEAVNAFQAGESDLFLISLKAGGFGLNLTAADYVVHMDPWWNPAVEDQASDRAHRIGQLRPVTIYRLVTKGTIEEKILDLHQHKRDLASSLLEGTDSGVKLSLEEMMDLLQAGDQEV